MGSFTLRPCRSWTRSLPRSTASRDAARPAAEQGGPYRTELDGGRDATAAREAEVAKLHAIRAARARRNLIFAIAVAVAFVVFIVLLARIA